VNSLGPEERRLMNVYKKRTLKIAHFIFEPHIDYIIDYIHIYENSIFSNSKNWLATSALVYDLILHKIHS
jgi:hypothetical protein